MTPTARGQPSIAKAESGDGEPVGFLETMA